MRSHRFAHARRSRILRLGAAATLALQLGTFASVASAQDAAASVPRWRFTTAAEWSHDTTIYGIGARFPLAWQREALASHALEAQLGFDVLRWVGNSPEGGHLWDINATPYLRWRPAQSEWNRTFLQIGIGIHLLSATSLQGAGNFGSVLQFGEQLAWGINFGAGNRYELLLLMQHVSNAGLASPNDGKTSYGAMLGIPLD